MSLSLFKCDMCKNDYYSEGNEIKHCCTAFPEGIPDEKLFSNDTEEECANGIKFEEDK